VSTFQALAAGRAIFGRSFNPSITLKALSYFDDVSGLPRDVRARLSAAAAAVDVTRLPILTPHRLRPGENGLAS
jgi:hypothetical protein